MEMGIKKEKERRGRKQGRIATIQNNKQMEEQQMQKYSSYCILKGVCVGIHAPVYRCSQPHVEAQWPEVDFRYIFQSFFHLIFLLC